MSEDVSLGEKGEDSLSELLRRLDFRASVFFRAEYCGRWAVDTSGTQQVPFHMVSHGEGWLHGDGQVPQRLVAGHLVLFPQDSAHLLTADEDMPDPATVNAPPRTRIDGAVTRLICGYFSFDQRVAAPLLASLPSTMLLDTAATPNATTRELVSLWMREAAVDSLGSDVAVDRLAELVFIQMLRAEIKQGRLPGVIGALGDARLGSVLSGIHRRPGGSHSMKSMARIARLSESAFAQRFKRQIGMSPGQYVRHWRMQAAAEALRNTDRSMADIAASLGYESEVAFRKAFRAHFDVAPGRYRRRQGADA